jgi:hypothetical protein
VRRRDEFAKVSDFLLGEGRVNRSSEHSQDVSASCAGCKVPFPMRGFVRPECPFRICCGDLGVRTSLQAAGSLLVKSFSEAPGERFPASPKLEFIFLV